LVVTVLLVGGAPDRRHGDPASPGPSAPSLVFDLPPPLVVLPADQDLIESTEARFRDATGADSVAVVHGEVPGGSAPEGVVVVSMELPRPVEGPDAEKGLVASIAKIAPLISPSRELFHGKPEWVSKNDAVLASSALVLDGTRAIFVYGGTSLEADTVLSILFLDGTSSS
jgi:hypothetical protein